MSQSYPRGGGHNDIIIQVSAQYTRFRLIDSSIPIQI